jgi:Fe(3+) dicitrate transport protein
MFVDKDTTLTTKLYGGTHRRDRFQTLYNSSNPAAPEASGIGPGYSAEYEEDGKILRDAFVGNDSMFGRLRTFRHIGVEGRAELANRPFFGGLTQDIQVGLRYEHQDMKNRNILGKSGEILKYGDSEGLTIFDRSLKSDAISAFLQTSIKATSDLRIVPGVRLEWYKVRRKTRVAAVEEGEADEFEDGVDFNESGQTCSDVLTNYGEDECHVIEGLTTRAFEDSTSSLRALPGIAFSYTGLYRTTVYGGYHRGQTKLVLRNEDFPAADEIGDNFELGIRTSAVRGITLEVAGFHQRLKNFQYGASFSTAGDRSFGTADEVHINGVEIAGRIDSQPWIGGPLNLYTQGQYTYARSIIKRGTTEDGNGNVVDLAGKHLPEVPFHIAALTLGLEGRTGWKWNASATYTYRGAFFTDEVNTAYGGDPEGERYCPGHLASVGALQPRYRQHRGQRLRLGRQPARQTLHHRPRGRHQTRHRPYDLDRLQIQVLTRRRAVVEPGAASQTIEKGSALAGPFSLFSSQGALAPALIAAEPQQARADVTNIRAAFRQRAGKVLAKIKAALPHRAHAAGRSSSRSAPRQQVDDQAHQSACRCAVRRKGKSR